MNFICIICSELLVATDEAFFTRCGHLFHYNCLSGWIERSQTCPQCRAKTTKNNIHKVYFSIQSTEENSEDRSSLWNQIENLTLQISLKENDLKTANDKIATLNGTVSDLNEQLTTAQNKCKDLEMEVSALAENNQFLLSKTKEAEHVQKDVDYFKNEVELLKRELRSSKEEMQNLRAKLGDSEQDLQAALVELDKLQNDPNSQVKRDGVVEEDICHQQNENRSPLKELQVAAISTAASGPSQSSVRKRIAQIPPPESSKRLKKSLETGEKTEKPLKCVNIIDSKLDEQTKTAKNKEKNDVLVEEDNNQLNSDSQNSSGVANPVVHLID